MQSNMWIYIILYLIFGLYFCLRSTSRLDNNYEIKITNKSIALMLLWIFVTSIRWLLVSCDEDYAFLLTILKPYLKEKHTHQ